MEYSTRQLVMACGSICSTMFVVASVTTIVYGSICISEHTLRSSKQYQAEYEAYQNEYEVLRDYYDMKMSEISEQYPNWSTGLALEVLSLSERMETLTGDLEAYNERLIQTQERLNSKWTNWLYCPVMLQFEPFELW